MRINLDFGFSFSGPDIRPGLDNRHIIIEGLACRIIVSALVPVPFLWTLDLGFGTWISDLDLASLYPLLWRLLTPRIA